MPAKSALEWSCQSPYSVREHTLLQDELRNIQLLLSVPFSRFDHSIESAPQNKAADHLEERIAAFVGVVPDMMFVACVLDKVLEIVVELVGFLGTLLCSLTYNCGKTSTQP